MITRRALAAARKALTRQAAVALVGPRQVGKTTLAKRIGQELPSVYADLEDARDRERIADAHSYFETHKNKLIILDEVHQMPELFPMLRGVIDRGRAEGLQTGRFLLLGSASLDLMFRAGETLAGRIAFVELNTIDVLEFGTSQLDIDRLWLRGGFPGSLLASDDDASLTFRRELVRTYLERDVSMFGARLPAETMRRMWTMLAHNQGCLLNVADLARSLMTTARAVQTYVDLLVDLLLVRRLQPFMANVGKRLVKSPKVYVRDSGLVHALLNLPSHDALLSHPVVGRSWEGFVIENLLACAPDGTLAAFYRTAAGAEVDLVLTLPGGVNWAIELKRSQVATVERGFHRALEDLQPARAFVVYTGSDSFLLPHRITAIPLHELMHELLRLK